MIDKEYGKYCLICDICNQEVGYFDTFDDAVDFKKNEGWKSQRGEQLGLKDAWADVCPECQWRFS